MNARINRQTIINSKECNNLTNHKDIERLRALAYEIRTLSELPEQAANKRQIGRAHV